MADIVIRGMEMLKEGVYTCELSVLNESTALLTIHTPIDKLQRSYKLVFLPERHGRLVDLDKLDYAFSALRFNEDGSLNHWDDRKNWCLHGSEIETILANAHTIVPAEGGKANEKTV